MLQNIPEIPPAFVLLLNLLFSSGLLLRPDRLLELDVLGLVVSLLWQIGVGAIFLFFLLLSEFLVDLHMYIVQRG